MCHFGKITQNRHRNYNTESWQMPWRIFWQTKSCLPPCFLDQWCWNDHCRMNCRAENDLKFWKFQNFRKINGKSMETQWKCHFLNISVILVKSLRNDIKITLQNHDEWLWEFYDRQKLPPSMFSGPVMPKRPLSHELPCGKRFGILKISDFSENQGKINENQWKY